MTSSRILDLFERIDDRYVLEAIDSRRNMGTVGTRKQMLLLAAAMLAALLLMGCTAAVHLWMNALPSVPERLAANYNSGSETMVLFGGTADDRLIDALWAWEDYHGRYEIKDPQYDVKTGHPEVTQNMREIYRCWTPEMVDKLREIMDKYGLQPAVGALYVDYYQRDTALELLGISSLVSDSSLRMSDVFGGYIDAPYNFKFEYYVTLAGESAKNYAVTETYRHKDYMPRLGAWTLQAEEYFQWQYTTDDGVQLLMALKEGVSGFIVAEQEQGYLSLQISVSSAAEVPLTRQDMEYIAENMNLSFTPQAVEPESAQLLLDAAWEVYELANGLKYRSVEAFLGKYSSIPLNRFDWQYAWFDLFEDGKSELFIGWGGSYKSFIVQHENGTVEEIHYKPSYFSGNYVAVIVQEGVNYTRYSIEQIDESFRKSFPIAELLWEDGRWYRKGKCITESEAQAIFAAYPPIELKLDWKPLREYPLSDGNVLVH